MKITSLFARMRGRRSATYRRRAQLRLETLETRAVFSVSSLATCNPPVNNPTNQTEVVFAPGTSAEVMAAYEDLQQQDGIAAFTFNDSDRWSRTATNATTLRQGDATTIRWSVVPDGTAVNGYNGEPAAPSNLRAKLAGIYGSNPNSTLAQDQPWFSVFQQVFDRWSAVSGVTYVYEAADDGAALGSSASGSLNVRGDVRISGHYIDGPYNILAYNFYPTVGDMVIDTGDTYFDNTASNSLRLRNTLAHEAGHGLGLGHVSPTNGTKLMEPSISLGFDGPQADDILAVNRGYGDRLEKNGGNNTFSTATALTGSSFSVDTISIDDDSDIDWFRFTVGTAGQASFTLTPTGSSYTSGSATFNSLTQSDLALAIYGTNGTTLLASANINGAGVAETLSNISLPGSGTYYVRVTGTANAAQMYRLTGSTSATPVSAPEIALLQGATDIADNSGSVSFGSVTTGTSATRTFTVNNTGNASLTLGTLSIPTGFTLSQALGSTTIAAGASTAFVVAMNTASAGTFSGQISLVNNDSDENPFNFTISGTVAEPASPEIAILDGTTEIADNTGAMSFGSVTTGALATRTFTVRNTGNASLTLGTLTLPTGFSVSQGLGSSTLAAGASTTFVVSMNTATATSYSGQLSLVNNDANENPYNFALSGTVTAPAPTAPEIAILDGTTEIADNSGAVSFGTVTVGTSASRTFTIRNTGNANLTLSAPTLPTGFTLTQALSATIIAPGGFGTFAVSMNTSAAASFSGSLSLANNDSNENPYNFTLSGTVVAPPNNPVTFSDNFNRTAGTSLGSNWTERSGNYTISSGTLANTSNVTSVATVNNIDVTDVILTADVTLGTGTATRDVGVVARQSGNGAGSQYWGGIRYQSGAYTAEIWEATNGSWSRLSSASIATGTATIRFEVVGSSLKLFVNNTLATSSTDTSLTSGRVGASTSNTGARLDNFSVATPAATVTAVTTNSPAHSAQYLAWLDQLLAAWGQKRER